MSVAQPPRNTSIAARHCATTWKPSGGFARADPNLVIAVAAPRASMHSKRIRRRSFNDAMLTLDRHGK
jgi:hypothetical protein